MSLEVAGSIPARGEKIERPGSSRVSEDLRDVASGKRILPHIILHQIDGDDALVEINDRMIVYKIGDQIPGAGQFVAVTRQDGRPALETSAGLIVEPR